MPASRLRLAVLFLVLLVVTARAGSSPLSSSGANWQLKSMTASFDPHKVRLSVDLAGAAGRPIYQAWYSPAEGALVIDVRDVDAAAASVPQLGPDALVSGWELRRPNFLTAQWVVKLGYAVPTSHIHSTLVGNTIVVDIDRSFTEQLDLPVTRNTSWRRRETRSGDDYSLVNELEVRLDSETSLRIAHAGDCLSAVEDPVAMARRKQALALINGGFFKYTGGPLSLVIDEGRVLVPNVSTRPPRTAVGVLKDGRVVMDRVEVKDDRPRAIDGSTDWTQVTFAVGGGPRLIRNGRIALTTDDEALGKKGNDITRKAGRTAVARLRNGHLLFITVSGYRDNHSQGWQLPELAAWLLARGAVDAMCLDGGGSVAMVVDGALVSRPPGGGTYQRKVANGLMLSDSAPRMLPSNVQVTAASHRVNADATTPVPIVATVTTADGRKVVDGTPVYFSATHGVMPSMVRTVGGRAAATFTPLRAIGTTRVLAWCGLASGGDELTVVGGTPRRLAARILPIKPPPPAVAATPGPLPTPVSDRLAAIEVMVMDPFHNALPDQDIEVHIGSVTQQAHSGADGVARLTVPLGAEVSTLRFVHAGVPAIEVAVP